MEVSFPLPKILRKKKLLKDRRHHKRRHSLSQEFLPMLLENPEASPLFDNRKISLFSLD